MATLAREPWSKARIDRTYLDISESRQRRLIDAVRNEQPITGLTHNFYRYPARFSAIMARSAIETFTSVGDVVLDPFVGGGTTLVEALSLGRVGVGSDISSLATFISTVKTTLLADEETDAICRWADGLVETISQHRKSAYFEDWAASGYYKHLDHPSRWRIRKGIEQALETAVLLRPKRVESFARCAILKTAQWALDGRRKNTTLPEFRDALIENVHEMLDGLDDLREHVEDREVEASAFCLHRSADGLETEPLMRRLGAPRLVVTSPPYPGIHVLYHRWQVGGGRETAAPFWIADRLDGAGSSYYTMGDRKAQNLNTYFESLRATLTSVAAVSDEATTIVQIVAFSDKRRQLPRYLRCCHDAGLREVFLPLLKTTGDGRIWRTVPNRRWYSDQKGSTPGSQEVVLLHKLDR